MKFRIEKVQSVLGENQAVLIFSGANRFYFTGFNSSAGVVVITPKEAVFLVDFRYFEKAKNTVKCMKTLLCTDTYYQIAQVLENNKITEVFLETETINLSIFEKLKEKLCGVNISCDNKVQNAINSLRAVKSSEEIEFIKRAQSITDSTFEYIITRIKEGKTEREIALDMEFFARNQGSDGVAFDFIVVSGKNSSLPHGVPTDKKFEKGDFITMDFGARVGGYCSDMTRTVALGEISEKQRKVYNTVLTAQKMALESIKAGVGCKEIDAVARNFINDSGFEGRFGHGLGHSLGLEIHESPAFNTRDTSILKSGTVITVEPGIYLENEFGVRIEDMVLVTDNGIENLTGSPKDLIIL